MDSLYSGLFNNLVAGVLGISDSVARGFDNVLRGSIWLILSGLVVNLSGLVFWLLSSRFAGASGVGYAASAVSISGLVSTLLNLGLSYAMLREIPVRGSKAFSSGLLIAFLLGLLGSLIVIYTPLSSLYTGFSSYAFLAVVMTILSMVSMVSLNTLVAMNMVWEYFLVVLASNIARIAVGIPLILLGYGGLGAAFGMLLASIVASMASLALSVRRLGLAAPGSGDLAEVLRIGVSNYPISLSPALVSGGVVAAGILTRDPEAAGVTYISLMISSAVGLIPSSVASVSIPVMMRGVSPELSRLGASLSASLVLPIAVGVGISSRSILGILGGDFSARWEILTILSLASIPYAAIANSMSRMNWERNLTRLATIGVASLTTLATLSPILAGLAGVKGIAIAYLASSIAPLPLIRGVDIHGIIKMMAIQAILTIGLSQPPREPLIDAALGVMGSIASIIAAHISRASRIELLRRAIAIAINIVRNRQANRE